MTTDHMILMTVIPQFHARVLENIDLETPALHNIDLEVPALHNIDLEVVV